VNGGLLIGGEFTQAGDQRSMHLALWTDAAAAVPEIPAIAGEPIRLLWSEPNPFRDGTHLRFALDQSGSVRIRLFDAAGRLQRTLLDRSCTAGTNVIAWDGRGANDEPLAPGVVFARIDAPGGSQTIKLVRVR
jgi:hypothetical protein